MPTYTIKQGQSIFDIALQLYGDVSKAIDLVKLNPTKISSLLEPKLAGKTIEYEVQTNETAKYFANKVLTTRYPEINALSSFSSAFSSEYMALSTE